MTSEPVSRAYLTGLRSDSAALRDGSRHLRSLAIETRAASREVRADAAHRYAEHLAAAADPTRSGRR